MVRRPTEPLRRLSVPEHGALSDVELDQIQVRGLSESAARLKVVSKGKYGLFDVHACELVGTVVAPGLQLVIRPKVAMSRVLFLLGYSSGAELDFGRHAELAEQDGILEVMQLTYAAALTRALRGGLVHDYVQRSDVLSAPRGRIGLSDLALRRFGVFPPVPCAFEEFTADIEVNRRLLAAAKMLERACANLTTKLHLRSATGRMEGVAWVNFSPLNVRRVKLDRRFGRYGAAPALADLVLRNASLHLHHGHTDSMSFVFDMNAVYEDFVCEALIKALKYHALIGERTPAERTLDVDGTVTIEPDLVVSDAARRSIPVDVKYKRRNQIPSDDAYQLAAYCQALQASEGALVYARIGEHFVTVKHGGPRIHVWELNPDGEPAELLDRVAQLAARIAGMFEHQLLTVA